MRREKEIWRYKNSAEPLSELDRSELFRFAKFITQTYKYFYKISHQKVLPILLKHVCNEKILKHPYFKNSINQNKKVLYAVLDRIKAGEESSVDLYKKLYILNTVYSIKFVRLISHYGANGHEKSAILYLAQRNYLDKILLNKPIFDRKMMIKEFDAIIIKKHNFDQPERNILVEDKYRLTKDGLKQLFGYNSRYWKKSHKDILISPDLLDYNDLPQITELEIIFTHIENKLKEQPIGKIADEMQENTSLFFAKEKFAKYLKNIVKKHHVEDLLLKSDVKDIVLTKIVPAKRNLLNRFLNPEIHKEYQRLLQKK